MDYVNDELKIYRGQDYVVSKHIHISQPTLGEICDYGEEAYFSMVHQLTATPSSLKAQLWKCGVDIPLSHLILCSIILSTVIILMNKLQSYLEILI